MSMLRRTVALLLAVVCAVASAAASEPSVRRLDSIAASPGSPCGIWQMAGGGAVFEVTPDAADGRYRMVIVDSPDFSTEPGTHFGTLTATGTPGLFDATLAAPVRGTSSRRPVRRRDTYTISVELDGDRMTLDRYHKGVALNLLRLLPYLFRIPAERTDSRPDGIDAALRIAPPPISAHTVL